MADEQWDKRADGALLVQPVLGYAFATLPKAALLRVIYAATQEDFAAQKPSAVQLAMTPQIARAMARMLMQIADAIEPPPPAFTVANADAEATLAESATIAPAPTPPPPASTAPKGTPSEPLPAFGYSIGDDPDELNFNYRS